MGILSQAECHDISFPDCEIVRFNIESNRLRIEIDGMLIDGRGLLDCNCAITIANWEVVRVRRYSREGANPSVIDYMESGGIKDICEWVLSDGILNLAGFSASHGLWQEYEFVLPQVSIQIQE